MSHNATAPAAGAIVAHYRAKGYRKAELRRVVARHVRLLRPLDPDVAEQLEDAYMGDTARERRNAEQRACRAAWAKRRARAGAIGAGRS